jgi:hypothetical protein
MTDTVQTYAQAIDTTFPIAGQDNNSQGFRDNFTNIQNGLNLAGQNLITLTANSASLVSENNFHGNAIYDVIAHNIRGKVQAGTSTVDMSVADYYTFSITSDQTITFTNWSVVGGCSKVRLQLASGDGAIHHVSFAASSGATVKKDISTTYPLTIPANSAHYVFVDVWVANGGAQGSAVNVFVDYVGEFG